jgi:hypothetical protein
MFAGRNNHVRWLILQKLLGTGIAGCRSVNAQHRNVAFDMQTSAARQLFADRLAS